MDTDETEDEDFNREYIEETNRDAVIIAVGKLVAVDAVPKVRELFIVGLSCDEFLAILSIWSFGDAFWYY